MKPKQLKKIKLPYRPNEITEQIIHDNLDSIVNQFLENKGIITKRYEIYKEQHDIYLKERIHDKNGEYSINTQVAEPHIGYMVDFKCGYVLGNPKEIATSDETLVEEVKVFNQYWKDALGRHIDDETTKYAYATGVGYYFIEPSKFIVPSSKKISPFKILNIEPDRCFKVYSSYVDEEELFDVLLTEISDNEDGLSTRTIVQVYTESFYIEYETDMSGHYVVYKNAVPRGIYKYLPLVEKYSAEERLGVTGRSIPMQDVVDRITSDSADGINTNVNQVWVFKNASLGDTSEEKSKNFASAMANGVVDISAPPGVDVGVDSIAVKLNITEIFGARDKLIQTMYSVNGVPMPNASVGSGNDGAAETGAGWNNAYTIALKEVDNFLVADDNVLARLLDICRSVPNGHIKELTKSDIDIKYTINRSNNLLVKSQAFVNFSQQGVPAKLAAQWCEITNDPESCGRIIEENRERLKQEEMELNNQNTQT